MDKPTLMLEESQVTLLREHVHLMIHLAQSGSPVRLEAIRSVLSSLFYYIAGIWTTQKPQQLSQSASSTRSVVVLDTFIKLVKENFAIYRNVGFYAQQLSLTPKYLSRIVKEASGRSAPEWIDEYVILEAKNLLKFSGLGN